MTACFVIVYIACWVIFVILYIFKDPRCWKGEDFKRLWNIPWYFINIVSGIIKLPKIVLCQK